MTNRTRYPRLFERLYGTPLMLRPEKAYTIERVFQAKLEGSNPIPVKAFFDDSDIPDQQTDAYQLTSGGVAIVQVMGTLVQRSSFMDALSGMTSYAEIGANFAAAQADPNVLGILLEIDSGGGEVNGCFDLVDQIAASTKPVRAVANEAAYSAAYAIASAADTITMPRTAGVGSIGVIALHVDESARDAKMGYAYTPIFAGDKKFDGNSHEPLPDGVRADIQADIDRLYGLFVSTVAANRNLSTDAVQATQADCFHTEAAIAAGLADNVGTLADAVTAFEADLAEPTEAMPMRPARATTIFANAAAAALPGVHMDTQNQAANSASITPEALASAQATAAAAGRTEGTKTGAETERARVAAILQSEEAKGRDELAQHLAFESDMASDKAIALLAKSPKVAPVAARPGSEFSAAMAAAGNPNVRADGGDEPTAREIEDATVKAIASFARNKPTTRA